MFHLASRSRGGYQKNLLLLHTRDQQELSDWQTVKAKIEALAPDIEVRIESNDDPDPATLRWQASRPSLVFSPMRLLNYRPLAGRIYAGQPMSKIQEWQRLAEANLPIPKTTRLTPGLKLDPAEWGAYVVVKPVAGLRGQNVRLIRTQDAAARFAELTGNARQRMIVQQFIDSIDEEGRTVSYRCLTMFGKPILSHAQHWTGRRPSLAEIAAGDGAIASNDQNQPRTQRLHIEPRLIELSALVAAAFPEIPCLGQDWVREHATGKFFILETNPAGPIWQLSQPLTLEFLQRVAGLGADYFRARYAQFGALDVVADQLIERTRADAC